MIRQVNAWARSKATTGIETSIDAWRTCDTLQDRCTDRQAGRQAGTPPGRNYNKRKPITQGEQVLEKTGESLVESRIGLDWTMLLLGDPLEMNHENVNASVGQFPIGL